MDSKINGLDNELRKFKEQLKKANGAAAAQIKKRAMDVLKRKVIWIWEYEGASERLFID